MSKEWARRAALSIHVVTMLSNFPSKLHPMSQFAAAVSALSSESRFAKAYADGIHKSKYWEVLPCYSVFTSRLEKLLIILVGGCIRLFY